ncbi:MAG: asparagine--tRNA ligase [Candidatus Ranarchaeia archaeon]
MKRTNIINIIQEKEKLENKEVLISGWVYHKREHGNIIFLDVRDGSGFIQVSVNKKNVDESIFNTVKSLTYESSIELIGTAKIDRRASYGVEVRLMKLDIISLAEDWPLPLGAGESVKADNKHLLIRSEKQRAVLSVRAEVFRLSRNWFHKNKYIETQPPLFITAAVEGGSTLFKMKYFDKEVFLTQSSQFYLEALCMSLGKVYCINPSFRAEKSRTRKHLSEFWHLEIENPWNDMKDVIKVGEEIIDYIFQHIVITKPIDVEKAGGNLELLIKSRAPFQKFTYDEAIDYLQKNDSKIQWGEDIGTKEEFILTEKQEAPIFVTHFPTKIKPFYHLPDPDNPEVTKCFDCFLPKGFGEVIGGGQRIDSKKLLLERIKAHKLKPKDYQWYIDLRRYGSVPHAGFGLGLGRLIRWIVQGEHIRNIIPFPRDQRRIYP